MQKHFIKIILILFTVIYSCSPEGIESPPFVSSGGWPLSTCAEQGLLSIFLIRLIIPYTQLILIKN